MTTIPNIRKARKAHTCRECGDTIEVGQLYHDIRIIWDGRAYQHKLCAHCEVAERWLAHNADGYYYDDGYPLGELWECIRLELDGRPWPTELRVPRWLTHYWQASVTTSDGVLWLEHPSYAVVWWRPLGKRKEWDTREELDAALVMCPPPAGELVIEDVER